MIKYNNCPICSGELIKEHDDLSSGRLYSEICINTCYIYYVKINKKSHNENHVFKIFGDAFSYTNYDNEQLIEMVRNRLNKNIESWKENDRYLVELMK